MENFETIETFDEINNDAIYDSENFPVKDRKHASSRRKKTYFRGKKRFDRLCNFGLEPLFRNHQVIRGMLRKTNIVCPTLERNSDIYHFNNRGTVRRLDTVNDKLAEFGSEDVEKPLIGGEV